MILHIIHLSYRQDRLKLLKNELFPKNSKLQDVDGILNKKSPCGRTGLLNPMFNKNFLKLALY